MSHTGIGTEVHANELFTTLVGAENAALPDIDLFDDAHSVPWDATSAVLEPIKRLDVSALISDFNTIHAAVADQLKTEHDAGRITGAKYAEVFLALTQGSLQSAVQFALGKDQAFWAAAKMQADAITSHNQNENMRLQAMLARANFALTKMKLAESDSTFGISEYQRESILPEQREAQRAQTASTRSDGGVIFDGTTANGLLGRQMALYAQQKQSYIEDIKIKASKIFADLWVTQKTMDADVAAIQADENFQSKLDGVVGSGTKLGTVFTELRDVARGMSYNTPVDDVTDA